MADGTPSIWRRIWPFGRSRPVVGQIGRATSRATALPITAKIAGTLPPVRSEARATVRKPDDQAGKADPAYFDGQSYFGKAYFGGPSDVTVTQGSGTPRVTVEQARESIRKAFRGDKEALLHWTERAQDNMALLHAALNGAGINDRTEEELRTLLADQDNAIANIRRLVEAGDTASAAEAFEEALTRWFSKSAEFLERTGLNRVIRGLLAAGALKWLDPSVAGSLSGFIVAAVISGIDTDMIRAITGGKDNDK